MGACCCCSKSTTTPEAPQNKKKPRLRTTRSKTHGSAPTVLLTASVPEPCRSNQHVAAQRLASSRSHKGSAKSNVHVPQLSAGHTSRKTPVGSSLTADTSRTPSKGGENPSSIGAEGASNTSTARTESHPTPRVVARNASSRLSLKPHARTLNASSRDLSQKDPGVSSFISTLATSQSLSKHGEKQSTCPFVEGSSNSPSTRTESGSAALVPHPTQTHTPSLTSTLKAYHDPESKSSSGTHEDQSKRLSKSPTTTANDEREAGELDVEYNTAPRELELFENRLGCLNLPASRHDPNRVHRAYMWVERSPSGLRRHFEKALAYEQSLQT